VVAKNQAQLKALISSWLCLWLGIPERGRSAQNNAQSVRTDANAAGPDPSQHKLHWKPAVKEINSNQIKFDFDV
jgi:hypothetical protein